MRQRTLQCGTMSAAIVDSEIALGDEQLLLSTAKGGRGQARWAARAALGTAGLALLATLLLGPSHFRSPTRAGDASAWLGSTPAKISGFARKFANSPLDTGLGVHLRRLADVTPACQKAFTEHVSNATMTLIGLMTEEMTCEDKNSTKCKALLAKVGSFEDDMKTTCKALGNICTGTIVTQNETETVEECIPKACHSELPGLAKEECEKDAGCKNCTITCGSSARAS